MKTSTLLVLFIPLFYLSATRSLAGERMVFPTEKIILRTDRDMYVAGENLFYSLSVIDETTHKLSEISKIVYLVLRDEKSEPIAKICMKLVNGKAFGNIYLNDTLRSGACELVAFTHLMRNKGESSFAYKELFIANLFDKELNVLASSQEQSCENTDSVSENPVPSKQEFQVETDKKEYYRNEKIRLKILFPGLKKNDISHISVSVHEVSPFHKAAVEKIASGHESILSADNSIGNPPYLPENKGRILSGKVTEITSGRGRKQCRVLLSAIDSVLNLQYCDTDTSGNFRFLVPDYYINKPIIIRLSDKELGEESEIETEDNFKLNSKFHPSIFRESEALRSYIIQSQNIVSVQKNYGNEPGVLSLKPEVSGTNIPVLYYRPDYRVYTSDFIPLPDFNEIARELLPTARLRKQKDEFQLTLTDLPHQRFFDNQPAIFYNGVLVNLETILPLRSELLERIEVVNTQYVCGSLLFGNGILAVFTKDKTNRSFMSAEFAELSVEPFTTNSNVVMPEKQLANPRNNPDFRQLLCWNPDLQIPGNGNTEIEFPASEHTASYIIEATVILSNGEILDVSNTFKIH